MPTEPSARPTAVREPAPLPTIGDDVAIATPTLFHPYEIGSGIHIIPAYLPVPGIGVLPANSFVVDGDEPVLVDAGPGGLPDGDFERALRSLVDPGDLRWLWLTHTDPDHIGALGRLLEIAPQMRVITTYLAVGKLGMVQPVPLDRCYFANPGDTVHVGDRQLVALRPPTFDAPETVGFYDTRSGTLFSADAFGAVLDAPVATADEIGADALEHGLVLWSTVDAPWLHHTERPAFAAALREVAALRPRLVASSHLPVADDVSPLLELTGSVPDATPWVGPDQRALEAMLAGAA
jgi:flavorubredoxin